MASWDATAEFALADAPERLLETVPDMAFLVDREGKLRWWNSRVPEVTGYADAELEGKDATELIVEGQRESAAEAIVQSATGDRDPEHREFDVLTVDGEALCHEFAGAVVRDDGEAVALTALARDVTERRERIDALQRQRDELETLSTVTDATQDVARALMGAASREEIERTVCERLVAADRYHGAWVGTRGPDGRVAVSTAVGASQQFADRVDAFQASESWTRPAAEALEENRAVVVHDIPNSHLPAEVRQAGDDLGVLAGGAFPIGYRDSVHGVLTVYASDPDAFSERETDAFRRLGEVIGLAIHAVRTQQLLLSESELELEFRVTGDSAFFTTFTEQHDCRCRLEWARPSADGTITELFTFEGVDPAVVEAAAAKVDYVEACRHVDGDATESVFEFRLSRSVVNQLMSAGARTERLTVDDGVATIVIRAAEEGNVRSIVDRFVSEFDADLVAKRSVDGGRGKAAVDGLTDRQREVLAAAFDAGYFEWPRDATAEELAETFDISAATVHYHLRGGLRRLVASVRGELE